MLLNNTGKWTFNKIAEDYDAVRPLYPEELIRTFIYEAGLNRDSRLLELGCGTGQLSRMLAPHGFELHALDIGENLIRIAETHCREYTNCRFLLASFEDFPIPTKAYDVVVAATAFHWLDPAVRFQKSADLLRPGGALCLIKNVSKHREQTSELRSKLDAIYARVIPPSIAQQYISLDSKSGDLENDFAASPSFGPYRRYSVRYLHTLSTSQYIRLLNTFSYQHNLPTGIKEQLFHEIAVVVEEEGGVIQLPYEAVLLIANRL